MLNSIGLQNPGVDAVATDYASRWTGWKVPIIVNVLAPWTTTCAAPRCSNPLPKWPASSSTSHAPTSRRGWTSVATPLLPPALWPRFAR